MMGAKVSQKRVPQTKLNSCSFDPLAAWNACSAMHPPKLAGLCYDVVPPATFQMVGYSFYVVLLVLKHVLPGFAMQCWNCLNVTCEQATTANEHKHLSIHGRDHTQTVSFLNSFSTLFLHLQTPSPPKKHGSVSKPCTPVVNIKIAGIYGCSSH